MQGECDVVVGLVLHFRTPERTLTCLRSLADDGIGEVVLVDNSEDAGRSIEAMQSGLARLADAGLRVEVLQPARNLGFAAGVGMGLEHVSRNQRASVLLINSDATLEPGALTAMCGLLLQHGLVVPRLARRRGSPNVSSLTYYQCFAALILHRFEFNTIKHPSGCCLLIRADQVRPDLFDKDFFFYGEDVMLGFDLARRGVSVAECKEATVIHAGSASAKNGSMFYEYHMVRAHWLLARKLARNGFERNLFVAARCVTMPLRACVRSVRGRSLTPWRGLFAATADVLRARCRSFTPPAVQSSSNRSNAARR
ncbi:MAG: glycosyltransferase family 2 protein [Betaproteobacteria bacterium]|nr:glycosyltransferase family 2 protein [Betaproteobacteria bacterium]